MTLQQWWVLKYHKFKKYDFNISTTYLCYFGHINKVTTISLDDFKNLWQIFEKLFFSMNDYDVVLSLLSNVNACDGWEIHILKINYH